MSTQESAQLSPKIEPLPGSVHAEFTRCNRAGCRCLSGALHGPFFRRYWRQDGKTRRAYIRLADVTGVQAACARYREVHLSRRAFWRMLWEFDELSNNVIEMLITAQHTKPDPTES